METAFVSNTLIVTTSNNIWKHLAGNCFISHSYADARNVERLCERLPEKVKPVLFEQVKPDPRNAVSDGIVPTILSCECLIYLERGESARSFWVAFERDYALRSGLKVFAWDPSTDKLRADEDDPLSLDVATFYHQGDHEAVTELLDWMRDNRHFDLTQSVSRLKLGSMSGDMAITLEEQLIKGGTVLYLCGNGSAATVDQLRHPGFREQLWGSDFSERYRKRRMGRYRNRQDPYSPFQFKDDDFFIDSDPYDYLFGVYARVDPELSMDWQPADGSVIDLLGDAADDKRFNLNRIDDLIVRLYEALLGYRHVCEISPPVTHAIVDEDLKYLPIEWSDKRGRERLRVGWATGNGPTWTLSITDAQDLMLKALKSLSTLGTPSQFDSRFDTDLPIDRRNFPAHYAFFWNWYPQIIELSMDIDASTAYVYVRRFPIPRHLKNKAKAAYEEKMAMVFP